MSMIQEAIEAAMAQIKSVGGALLKIVLTTAGVAGLAHLTIDESAPVLKGLIVATTLWGAVMFFFAEHMTGKNFWTGVRGSFHWVDTATPIPVWKIAGGVLWGIAGVCLVIGWIG